MFAVQLPKSSDAIVIETTAILTHALTPRPAEITQKEPQLVQYVTGVYVPSPYVTKRQVGSLTAAHQSDDASRQPPSGRVLLPRGNHPFPTPFGAVPPEKRARARVLAFICKMSISASTI